MSEKTEKILEDLKTLTLLEGAELISMIEDTFDVDASSNASGVAISALAATSAVEEVEEKNRI